MAFNFGPLPLRPDTRYEWRFSIEKIDDGPWTVTFSTRPGLPPGMSGMS
jgi:hypothetical protein